MKGLIKKNQLMITALAIMIAIAGYLQFAGTGLEDEYQTVDDGNAFTRNTSSVTSGGVITENYTADGLLDLSEEDLMNDISDIESLDTDIDIIVDDYLDADMQIADVSGTAEGQTAGNTPDEGEIPGEAVFTSTTGVTILSDAKLLKEQTRAKNKETLLEIINSTGISDEQKQAAVNSMVEMTEIAEKEAAAEILLEAKGFQDVVVNATVLDDAMRAQIEDIVKRKTEISAENITISTIVP